MVPAPADCVKTADTVNPDKVSGVPPKVVQVAGRPPPGNAMVGPFVGGEVSRGREGRITESQDGGQQANQGSAQHGKNLHVSERESRGDFLPLISGKIPARRHIWRASQVRTSVQRR